MNDRKLVAVVVPLSDRPSLEPDEEISLRHLLHHLGRYDRYLVMSETLPLSLEGFGVRRFSNRFFGSADAYKRLILSRQFYEAFQDYEYMLIYHLDALVFSDQLEEWCATGYDFIGAPWLRSDEDPEQGFGRVGNGGFSLRRISSCLRVLDSTRYATDPDDYWDKHYAGRPLHQRVLNLPKKYAKRLKRFNSAEWEMTRYPKNCDIFWAYRAQHFVPDFRIAPVEVALRFAFERAPDYCFERNGRRLPFGCHAWARYDRAFWEPYLLEDGDVEATPPPPIAARTGAQP